MKQRSKFFVFGTVHKCILDKGTGDGLPPSFPPEQEKIRREGRGYLIGKEPETQVPPVPRPLDESEHPHWPHRQREYRRASSIGWHDDDDCA